MLSRREIIAVIFLLTLLTGVVYYFLYLSPKLTEIGNTQSSIDTLEAQIAEAQILENQYNLLVTERDDLLAQWENFESAIPLTFDDSEVLRLLQRIIYPHTKEVNVSFPAYQEPVTPTLTNPTQKYTITLDFNVRYESLDEIWQAFSEETLVNRIVNYYLTRFDDTESGDIEYGVSLEVDFLTQQ
jgi:hypothetical protein